MRSKDATEEEKFESIESMISQLFLVDTFTDFSKRVKSPSDTGLYCKNKAFTEAWASEITNTLDGGVNRPCGQLIRSQYIAKKEFPLRAALLFQDDIRRARDSRTAPSSAQLFNPWQKKQ